MNAAQYSRLGYLILKKESSAGTPLYPDTPIEILSESIKPNWDITSVGVISGSRSENVRPAKNRVGPFNGAIEILVEPKMIGHFLCGFFGEDVHTTITAGVSEQSDFQPLATVPAYTMDIKIAGEAYVTRYFGVRIAKMNFSLDGNKLKCVIDVTAQRVFTNARVTTAASSGTALAVDQTSGLTTSDTLQVLSGTTPSTVNATLTISSITSELALVVSTIGASLAVNDIVVIKARTIDDEDYSLGDEFIWAGGADVFAAAGANAMQQLATKTNCETFELALENMTEPRWAATGNDIVDRMPATILLKGVKVTGKFSQFHADPGMMDILRNMSQLALRFRFLGAALAANSAVAASGTIVSAGAGTVVVTVDTAGEDGNDYAIVIVTGTGALSASKSGKLITVTLSSTPSNNTVTLVAAAIDALSGVASASTASDQVTAALNADKIEFSGGRDASEREMLRFDIPNARVEPFHPNLSNDAVVEEVVSFTAYRDVYDGREVKVRLRNVVTVY